MMSNKEMKRIVLFALALAISLSLTWIGVASADFAVNNFRLSTTPNGPATTAFPAGTTEVYAVFDYVDATGIPIQLKLYDPVGQVLYLETFEYQGSGSESIKISNGGFPFSDGAYVLNMYTGKIDPNRLDIYQSIEWTVGEATIPESGSSQVIATVVVPGAQGTAATGTSSIVIATLVIVLIVLVVMVGWAVRGFVASRS